MDEAVTARVHLGTLNRCSEAYEVYEYLKETYASTELDRLQEVLRKRDWLVKADYGRKGIEDWIYQWEEVDTDLHDQGDEESLLKVSFNAETRAVDVKCRHHQHDEYSKNQLSPGVEEFINNRLLTNTYLGELPAGFTSLDEEMSFFFKRDEAVEVLDRANAMYNREERRIQGQNTISDIDRRALMFSF